MKAVLFGATGMVGQGVLRECLFDPDVEGVLAIVRNSSLPQHDKLREIVHQDVSDLSLIQDRLSGFGACFFCLGVSAVGMKEDAYLEQVKTALLAIRDKVTDAQLRMLKAHYVCRRASVEQIANLGGYGENYRAGNLQCGVLCGRIAGQLGFVPEGNKTSTIASVSSEPDEERHFQWRMDDVIANALEEIGWVSWSGSEVNQ